MSQLIADEDLDQKIFHEWLRTHAPRVIWAFRTLPRIPLPNTDRDDGDWCLGIDRKHDDCTVLLYANFGKPEQTHRRIAVIHTRRELIRLYDHLCGRVGAWQKNGGKL